MIDNVAKAMETRRRELIAQPLNRIWPELARAAIEAMREPTDAMLYNMDGCSDLVGPYPESNTKEERLREFRGAYRAAIDKALEA